MSTIAGEVASVAPHPLAAHALRACFVNHRTTEDDVRAIHAVLVDLADST